MSTTASPFSFGSAPSYGNAIRGKPTNIPTQLQDYSSVRSGRGNRGPVVDTGFELEQAPESSISTNANYHIVYTRKPKRITGGVVANKMNQRGLIQFAKKINGLETRPNTLRFTAENDDYDIAYTMLNLPTMNCALQKRNANEERDRINIPRLELHEFRNDFYIDGVVTSDRGGESNGMSDDTDILKVYAVVVFGKTEVFNHWGYITIGDRLFFIVKRQFVKSTEFTVDGYKSIPKETSASQPIQIIPWVSAGNPNARPSMDDLQYEEDGFIKYGYYIYFGRVEKIAPGAIPDSDYNNTINDNKNKNNAVMYDIGYLIRQPLISVLIDPQ